MFSGIQIGKGDTGFVFLLIACVYCFHVREGTLAAPFTTVGWLALGLATAVHEKDGRLALPGYLQAGVCALMVLLGVAAAYQHGLEASDFSYLLGMAAVLYIYREGLSICQEVR